MFHRRVEHRHDHSEATFWRNSRSPDSRLKQNLPCLLRSPQWLAFANGQASKRTRYWSMRGFKEHLTTSARAVSERFFDQSRYRKRSNTLCISRFRYRRVGGKDPLTVADDVVRCSLLPHFLVKPCPLTKPPLRTQRLCSFFSIQYYKTDLRNCQYNFYNPHNILCRKSRQNPHVVTHL